MVKTKYPKNRKSLEVVVALCVDCSGEFMKNINNKVRCEECQKNNVKRTNKRNHIKRWGNKEYRDKVLEYNDKWRKNNREKTNAKDRERRKKCPEKIKAREAVRKLPIGKECGICKSTENLQKHHWRYDKPELFSTMCSYCHSVQHLKRPKEVTV